MTEYEEYLQLSELMHYGTPHDGARSHSGRYKYGSGDIPYQHENLNFLGRVDELRKQGLSDSEVAKALNIIGPSGQPSSSVLRTRLRVINNEKNAYEVANAIKMREQGYTLDEIAKEFDWAGESTVRSKLKDGTRLNVLRGQNTADLLKDAVDSKGFIEVGKGVERELGVSKNTMDEALAILESQGYRTFNARIDQVTNPNSDNKTTLRILCPKGIEPSEKGNTPKEVYAALDANKVETFKDYYTDDGGVTFESIKMLPPTSIKSDRIMVRYGDQGGQEKDGVIEIRRGAEGLDLNGLHYAQVRIGVDNTHYLKGMAIYGNDSDFPKGKDIIFNTNKSSDKSVKDVLKSMKRIDPNDKNSPIDTSNPFGAYINRKGQHEYIDSSGKKKLSPINILKGEGDWDLQNNKLSAQFLAKQPDKLIKQQLDIAYANALNEYNEINSITNKTIKRYYLDKYAKECEKAAIHMEAAALPRQRWKVILPSSDLKEAGEGGSKYGEIYAPTFANGEIVSLVRYPHGGTFEIPTLIVNNNNKACKAKFGNMPDAVAITPKSAEKLSGADFDGDTALVIPHSRKVQIVSRDTLKGLEGFDPKTAYPPIKGMKKLTDKQKGREMGIVSNLIMDMTLKGAPDEDLEKAVKHSMVVIDAVKHKLNYKQSEIDNDINYLKKKYQWRFDEEGNKVGSGPSTLLTRSNAEVHDAPRYVGQPKVNIKGKSWYDSDLPEGALIYKVSEKKRYNKKTGEYDLPLRRTSVQGSEVRNAYELVSDIGNNKERLYADYSNKMRALSNLCRKEEYTTGRSEYHKSAAKTYGAEVRSLEMKLNTSMLNAPRERKAQIIANSKVKAAKASGVQWDKAQWKKYRQMALEDARDSVSAGSKHRKIVISDREWEAIQAGAISDTKLSTILNNTDADSLRARATPRSSISLSDSQKSMMKAYSGTYTIKQIADRFGVSPSTVSKILKEG